MAFSGILMIPIGKAKLKLVYSSGSCRNDDMPKNTACIADL